MENYRAYITVKIAGDNRAQPWMPQNLLAKYEKSRFISAPAVNLTLMLTFPEGKVIACRPTGKAKRVGKTVFWSWQSDLDGRVTRDLICLALKEAIGLLSADLEEADRPSLTSDTQGVAGTPDIVATILRKIDEAGVFVGDVTPIAMSKNGKACANPNVLLEMGYANKALTEQRVIQVWNTAFEGATIEKLPFDMRGRRAPLSFNLPVGADTLTLRAARDKLAKDLSSALKMALNQLPPPPPEAVHWHPHSSSNKEVWFDPAEPQTVNHRMQGSSRVRWKSHFPSYARIIPSKWTARPGAKQSLAEGHPAVLARISSFNSGVSRAGTMAYLPEAAEDGVYPTKTLTQWFEKTGEFWGVGGGFLFQRQGGQLTLATGYVYRHWLNFLQENCKLALAHGGSLPIHVRLGVSDLRNSWWPQGVYQFNDEGYAALEEAYEYEAKLTSITPETVQQLVVEAFNGLAAAYGIEPHTHEQIVSLSRL